MGDWAKNPDVLELLRYNREAKEAACEHANTSLLDYYGYEALCHDCGGRIWSFETRAYKLAMQGFHDAT